MPSSIACKVFEIYEPSDFDGVLFAVPVLENAERYQLALSLVSSSVQVTLKIPHRGDPV